MKQEKQLPTPFDDYEISGVREYGKGKSKFCEQVDDDEAQFWSLYGHIPGEGLECIGDFKTRQHAMDVYARITRRPFDILPAEAKCSNDDMAEKGDRQ